MSTAAAHDWLMTLRPLSQFLRLLVVPEIDRRVASGVIAATALPFQVRRFRMIQNARTTQVEINDEVKLLGTAKVTRPVQAGEPLTIHDIDPNEVYLTAPELDGKPAAFFLCQASFLNLLTVFDFTPNAQFPQGQEPDVSPIRYPIGDILQAGQLVETIRPIERYKQLADRNWPPGPGYYPHVLLNAFQRPAEIDQPSFADVVAGSYDGTYLRDRLAFWEATEFFGDRLRYVSKSIDEYLEGDSISCIRVLVPEFEGVIRDYLNAAGITPRYRAESCVPQLKELVLSRTVLMAPRPVIDLIFEFIQKGTFLAETAGVADPGEQVSRHGVAHGVFVGYEDRDIALKYLILFDALAFVLMHDKLFTGKL